jgi:hypothetical protein
MKTRSVVLPVVLLVMSLALHAQTSQVSGQISDTTHAAVSGAKLTLVRVETGDHREGNSTDQGYYSFPLLLPGHYDLTIEKDGFAPQRRTGIVVETGAISAVDVELAIGSNNETVNVDASVPLLQTETSAVAHVVENDSITNLPLIDRRSSQLQKLNGFVVQRGAGAGSSFAVAGGRGDNADYQIDGGTAQNLLLGVPILMFDPPVDSVQEFNVAQSTYSAELGRSGGGVVQISTKSGTNSFHGSAYEYLRNDVLQAVPDFAVKNPTLRYNLFGASLGGPIKKNKTQFFFNYEGLRQKVATPQSLIIPTAQELTGNFNGIIDPKTGQQVIIADPATGQPFANNQIPTNRLDSVGLSLAAFYPHVNGTTPTVQYSANVPLTTVRDAYVARVDHVFGANDRIFGRLLVQKQHDLQNSVFSTPGTDRWGYHQTLNFYSPSANWYHNFGPNKINELRLTYSRRNYLYYSAGANTTLDSQIGLDTFDTKYFPTVILAGGASGLEPLGNTVQQQREQTPVISNAYVDTFSWQRGSHQIKFGGEVRTSTNTDKFRPYGGGLFTIDNRGTSTNLAAGSIANLLLGNVFSGTINEFYTIHAVAQSYGGFVQDDWRVTPRLTLNIGLRYDVDSPRKTDPNAQNLFDPQAINPVSGTPGVVTFSGVNGVGAYAHKWDLNNFGPRLGFAWSPADKWVIRGGGGILYTPEYDSATPTVANLGYGTTGSLVGSYNRNSGILSPAFQFSSIPVFWISPTAADLTAGFGAVAPGQRATTVVQYFDPNHVNGYLYQASFDIQHQIGNGLLLDVGYLGTFGHSLPVTDNAGGQYSINQIAPNLLAQANANPATAQSLRPFPQFQNVQLLDPNIGASKYNGANIGVQKKFSQGLQFLANYTWSKFEDNADARNELAGYPGDNSYTNYYNPNARWGLSGNDIRQRLIVSGLYELPIGKGKQLLANSGVLNQVVGGWTIGTVAELHTGTPLSVIDAVNGTNSFSDGVRPDLVGNPILTSSQRTATKWFNTAAFGLPTPSYAFGDAPRTFGTGPGTVQVDASLLKTFHVHESTNLQFRAEALNVLNHGNWANPNTLYSPTNPNFGKVTGLQLGNQSRILQVALQLTY